MRGFLLAIALALLAGCGTTHATIETSRGEDLMLLGFDPVAYFTDGKPVRGMHTLAATTEGRTYYFASPEHRSAFERSPAKYEPQYGGFCSNGAPYAVKLGSDPTQFEIRDGGSSFSAISSATRCGCCTSRRTSGTPMICGRPSGTRAGARRA